jgi:hypothetical protein
MKFSVFILGVFFFSSSYAQIDFSSLSFNEALQKAQSEGKLIFLQFEAASCSQCNDVANKGFDNKEVADKINETFFCLKIDAQHPDRDKIATTYNLNAKNGFGTLFIDHNGAIIHKFLKTTSRSKEYLTQLDIALIKAGESMNINVLEKEYQKGNRGFGLLQSLLLKRRSLAFPTDSLLDEYIDALPDDSSSSVSTLCFIAEMAPVLDSKADKFMRNNPNVFNRAWYTMSLAKRTAINNIIINKSLRKAIKEKDENYAVRSASFAQATNTTNYTAAARAYDMNMLRFYDGTNDTTKYFRKAIAYYDKYFMNLNPDSFRKMYSMNLIRLLMSPTAKKDTVIVGNTKRITTNIAYRPIAQYYASELNNGAYKFFLKTNNSYLLSIAEEWAEKASQLFRNQFILDTYAKVLYKENKTEIAIHVMQEAIALQQKQGYPTKEYEAVLEAMKSRKTLKE